MSEICIAFSELEVEATSAAIFGLWAESKIQEHYLGEVHRRRWYPFNKHDFRDPARIWGKKSLMGEFLMEHNPGRVSEIKWRLTPVRIPDIMTDDKAIKDFEFYEIKPNSLTGEGAGRIKVAYIQQIIMKGFKLPYKAGDQYKPDVKIEFATGTVFGVDIKFLLHFFWKDDGLLLYRICVDGEFDEVLKKVGQVFFVAALIGAFLYVIKILWEMGKRIPIPTEQ